MIWFFHPIFYSAAGMAGVGVPVVFLAACWMATHVFPIYCGNLVNLRPPGTNLVVFLWGVLLVVARNNPEKETW